ncbi:uncharacterized protein LOC135196207 [Macrobrachium nipponense]|uniref:uncharacterized protein LOC135196207 n=1 Tax=Macrobrachium nipponense TaxID=159736 RepID=UPI0030C88123
MTACAAGLQQACGHEVCRSHAPCAVQVDDLMVWHPDACETCYELVSKLTVDSTPQATRSSALSTLKIWVGGFARNVKAKKPYILSEEMCNLIYPNAKISAAVAKAVADPIIAKIREDTQVLTEDLEAIGEAVLEDVAAINLDLEPMVLEAAEQGREVREAGGARSRIPILSPAPSNSSSQTSFQGFTGKNMAGSCSVIPKVEQLKKTLPKSGKPSKLPRPSKSSLSTKTSKDSVVATSSHHGSRARSSSKAKTPEVPFDPVSFSSQLMEQMGSLVQSQIGSLADRLQSVDTLAQRLQNQESYGEPLTIRTASTTAVRDPGCL